MTTHAQEGLGRIVGTVQLQPAESENGAHRGEVVVAPVGAAQGPTRSPIRAGPSAAIGEAKTQLEAIATQLMPLNEVQDEYRMLDALAPVFWLVTYHTARNQTGSGVRVS